MRTLLALTILFATTTAVLLLVPSEVRARTVTLSAPAGVERVSIDRTENGTYNVMVHACAQDASTDGSDPLVDCGIANFVVPASNTALSDLFSKALTAWKKAKGY